MPSLISADETLIDQQIRSERESDFDSNSAYGEVIDNSIQAGAKNIKIIFDTKLVKKKKYLKVLHLEMMATECLQKLLKIV